MHCALQLLLMHAYTDDAKACAAATLFETQVWIDAVHPFAHW